MNSKLKLLKLIALITLASGFLVPTKVADAASSETAKSAEKQEILKEVPHEEGHKSAKNISQVFLSPKAKKIEFFGVLGIIGCSLFFPELFKRSAKKTSEDSQPLESTDNKELELEHTQIIQEETVKSVVKEESVEPDISYLEEILKNTKPMNFLPDNLVKLEDHKKNGFKSNDQLDRKIS